MQAATHLSVVDVLILPQNVIDRIIVVVNIQVRIKFKCICYHKDSLIKLFRDIVCFIDVALKK